MKIVSYNVNGVRAAMSKGLIEWLSVAQPDVLCLQEIKAQETQIEVSDFKNIGYEYCYWFSAEKKGYSGVAILSKQKPNAVEYGSQIPYMDAEGRIIRADFDQVSVMSLYLPSGTNLDRLGLKFQFMEDFYHYINKLKKRHPKLVISGDYNICHQAIDIHDPVRNAKVSGFLPEERAWLDAFIKNGFIDSFRYFSSDAHQYSWWSYRANSRANNKGWRIDYQLVTKELEANLKNAWISPEAHHSDHCPVGLELLF